MDANIQLTKNSSRQLHHDKIFSPDISLIFSKIPDISLTAVKFPDISRFSRQVVTLKYLGLHGYAYFCSHLCGNCRPASDHTVRGMSKRGPAINQQPDQIQN